MAIAQEMAETIASLTDKPAAVTVHHLRNLRDAGLITKSGRGPSAARMEVDDAVMLLLATAGTERLKDSVLTAKSLAALRAGTPLQTWHRKELRVGRGTVLALPEGHTLATALRCAFGISALSQGLESDSAEARESMYLVSTSPPRLSVEIFYPWFAATIEIEIPRLVRETWRYGTRALKSENEFRRSCKFASPTFDAVNKLLAQP
jgi:DNA-binding transcriptional ArsR family regulator